MREDFAEAAIRRMKSRCNPPLAHPPQRISTEFVTNGILLLSYDTMQSQYCGSVSNLCSVKDLVSDWNLVLREENQSTYYLISP